MRNSGRGREESRKRTKLKTYIRFNITLKKDEEKVIKKKLSAGGKSELIKFVSVVLTRTVYRYIYLCTKKKNKGTARTVIVIVS